MDYQHSDYVSQEYNQNNLEYLILSMIHLIIQNTLPYVGANILNLLLLYELFMFFHV